jgi:hypothetical protein
MSFGRENSFGEWLMPPTLGMKIRPTGPRTHHPFLTPKALNNFSPKRNAGFEIMGRICFSLKAMAKLGQILSSLQGSNNSFVI